MKKLLTLLFSVFIFSCVAPGETSGMLTLHLNQEQSRTFLPDIEIKEYEITGNSSDGSSFSQKTTLSEITVPGLTPGMWDIAVKGLNLSQRAVLQGSASVDIKAGGNSRADINLKPVSGQGSLNITVTWPAGKLTAPSLSAILTPFTGSDIKVNPVLSASSAGISASLNNGYYALFLILKDQGTDVMGITETLYIAAGEETRGTVAFNNVNQAGSGVVINISQTDITPVEVSLKGVINPLPRGSEFTAEALITNSTENTLAVWSVNGKKVHTGASFTLTAPSVEFTNLSATVFSIDGTRAGSTSVLIQTVDKAYPPHMAINEVQGAGHTSPFSGQDVQDVLGVVTAVSPKGYWIQSPVPDSDDKTSEGLYIYTKTAPSVEKGDLLLVSGKVKEFGYTNELKLTELVDPLTHRVLEKNHPLPEAVVLGKTGRIPPSGIICNDATETVYNSLFDPAEDAIDFYESLESMMVTVNNPVAVGGTKYGEIPVLSDGGELAPSESKNSRGGVTISENNYNPHILLIDSDSPILGQPALEASLSDRFSGPVTGIIGYSYGKFLIQPSSPLPSLIKGNPPRETTNILPGGKKLTTGFLNVENFPRDDAAMSQSEIQAKIDDIARTITAGMNSPDIIGLAEMTDDSYSVNDGTVSAAGNYMALINAISAAGGPSTYEFREVAPANNSDGGWPGANIRNGFLFNSARVQFVDKGSANAQSQTSVLNLQGKADIDFSPGRLQSPAFTDSRKPVIGKFIFENQELFIIVNHFKSKGGDTALMGEFQPPKLTSELKRNSQAEAVKSFTDQMLAIDPETKIIIMGDLNDFSFSLPLITLKGSEFKNLTEELLPPSEQYTYIYNGNSQQLDHILVSMGLYTLSPEVDIVHRYAEYSSISRHTDHDPIITSFLFP